MARTFDAGAALAYVADGHHRSASAWRAGKELRARNPSHRGDEEYNWFLAVLFPADQLRILPYNRVVRDLNGQTPARVLERLGRSRAALAGDGPGAGPARQSSVSFSTAAGTGWSWIRPRSTGPTPSRRWTCPCCRTGCCRPILGIGDPRTDKRIDFVGGIRGTAELERRVRSGEMAIAFSLFPTTLDQLMAVSDAGTIMPPKSTWFEPKLRSGLFVHELS